MNKLFEPKAHFNSNRLFFSNLQRFDTKSFRYRFENPFAARRTLPRVVTRYGGKGNFYQDYEPYVYDMAKACGAKTFVDCFGGGGTMSMMALMMLDYDTYEPLFDKVIYNDLDISVFSTFQVVKDPDRCDKLVERILDTPYDKDTFENAHRWVALLNISDIGAKIKKDITQKDYELFLKVSQLSFRDVEVILKKVPNDYNERVLCLIEEMKKLKLTMKADDIAYYAFIENAMSYNGAGQSFRDYTEYDRCSIDYERKMYLAARRLTEITPLLDRLEVSNKSYTDLIDEARSNGTVEKCIWFLDPPYYTGERAEGAGAVYKNEFENKDHLDMIDGLVNLKHWLLCGYSKDLQEMAHSGDIILPTSVEVNNIKDDVKRAYAGLPLCKNVSAIDLDAKYRPAGSKALADDDPHEILWLKS